MSSLKDQYASELLRSIPVVKGMNISIESLGKDSLRISAPLDSNINYEGTAFGGSLNTTCILSCYLLVHHVLKQNDIKFKSLVIQDSEIKYLIPVDGDFGAQAFFEAGSVQFLIKQLHSKGRGRVSVNSQVSLKGESETRVNFKGRFVVTS